MYFVWEDGKYAKIQDKLCIQGGCNWSFRVGSYRLGLFLIFGLFPHSSNFDGVEMRRMQTVYWSIVVVVIVLCRLAHSVPQHLRR